jgi:hypothetical protein
MWEKKWREGHFGGAVKWLIASLLSLSLFWGPGTAIRSDSTVNYVLFLWVVGGGLSGWREVKGGRYDKLGR